MVRRRMFWSVFVLGGALVVLAGAAGARSVAAGDQVWVNRYNGPGNGVDGARAIGVSPDGTRVFVTGHNTGGGSGLDYATQALDASNGNVVWTSRFNGSGNGDDEASALAVSRDGTRVFVTGKSASLSAGFDFVTIAYDASTGATLWVRRYNGPGGGDDSPSAIALSPDGASVYVTGSSYGGATSGDDYATEALNASTGAVRWIRRYNGPGNGADDPRALAVTPDGAIVAVTGASEGSTTGSDYATVAYDAAAGSRRWVARYNGPAGGTDGAVAVAASTDGSSFFVTGTAATSTAGDNFATLAYDASTGSQLWKALYNGVVNGDDEAASLALTPDGKSVLVIGTGPGSDPGFGAFERAAYNTSTGALLWRKAFQGPSAVARAVAISPDGSHVFTTGESLIGGSIDYLTNECSCSTDGFSYLYDGPAHGTDGAYAVAVSPDSRTVFVTGQSQGSTSGDDYATVAYQT